MSYELDCRMQDTSNLLLKMFSCFRIDPLLTLLLLQQFQQFFVAVIIFIACMSQRACFELVEMVLKILQRYKSLLSFLKRNNPFQNISNRFRLLFCRLIFQYIILLSCAYYLMHCYEEIISYYNPNFMTGNCENCDFVTVV